MSSPEERKQIVNIRLPPEMDQLVREKVQRGLYSSANEVILEALRPLKERDELRQSRLEELRSEIQVGLKQLDQGQFSTDDDASLPKLVDEVRAAGRKTTWEAT